MKTDDQDGPRSWREATSLEEFLGQTNRAIFDHCDKVEAFRLGRQSLGLDRPSVGGHSVLAELELRRGIYLWLCGLVEEKWACDPEVNHRDCDQPPEVAFRFHHGQQRLDLLVCYHCQRWTFVGPDGLERRDDFAPQELGMVMFAQMLFPDDHQIQALVLRNQPDPKPEVEANGVKLGMSQAEVERRLGPGRPGLRSVWFYDKLSALYHRGQLHYVGGSGCQLKLGSEELDCSLTVSELRARLDAYTPGEEESLPARGMTGLCTRTVLRWSFMTHRQPTGGGNYTEGGYVIACEFDGETVTELYLETLMISAGGVGHVLERK
ncbi:MAG: hypothetical protein KC910_22915 [Candidatus Eremiobacteraeota bacterium]|nr:hypothetical protein [Candidatus Eremiobacteraeota bacterium]